MERLPVPTMLTPEYPVHSADSFRQDWVNLELPTSRLGENKWSYGPLAKGTALM